MSVYTHKLYVCVCFPGAASGKEPACQCRRPTWLKFNLWVRKIPWSSKWQPTPVFLPGESHGQRNLMGCSPWGHKRIYTHMLCCCFLVAELCQILCDPVDCSPPGYSVHGIFQARIMDWIAISFSSIYYISISI